MSERTLPRLQLLSTITALLVGLWLPLRLLGYPVPAYVDTLFDLLVSATSIVNIRLYFHEHQLNLKSYKNWLRISPLLDLTCVIPHSAISLLLLGDASHPILLTNLLAARHIWRIKPYLDSYASLPPVTYRLVPVFITMPVIIHLIACAWIGLGSGSAGSHPDKVIEYIQAIYWTITTLATVGYGDIVPKSPVQMLFATSVQLTGVAVFGYVLSNVASLMARADAARDHHMNNVDRVETFMRSHHVPDQIKSRVRGYYNYVWSQHKGYTDKGLISHLPHKIQSELLSFINQPIVRKVPLFQNASEELLEDLMTKLRPMIAIPGQKIFRAGDEGDALYFIQHGEVDIVSEAGVSIAKLQAGQFFGEMALISDRPRQASAIATTYCDLYFLDRSNFNQTLHRHAEFRQKIESVIQQRTTELS
jgi:hypothetical protein